MQFIENRGQIIDMNNQPRTDILYTGDGNGMKVYLRKTGISYVINKIEGIDEQKEETEETRASKSAPFTSESEKSAAAPLKGCRVDLDLVESNTNATVIPSQQVEGYFNYYLGHCPGGLTNVQAFNKIVYENIYNNIDIAWFGGNDKGLKYDIIVKPGGNPNEIKLKYSGTEKIQLGNGKLKMEFLFGTVAECMPRVYQNIDGKLIEVQSSYILNGTTVSFEIAEYNTNYTLIIDPWVTYYGGSMTEYTNCIATDGNGNVLLTGLTFSTNFPISTGAFQLANGGIIDMMIVKFDFNGRRVWSTYYGGDDFDRPGGIATDGLNAVLLTGYTTSTNFPLTTGAFQNTLVGGSDAFITKLDANGALIWSTLYGGNDSGEHGTSIVTDAAGNIGVTGYTGSRNFPVTPGAFQNIYGGNFYDAFILKFSPGGNRLWATFYGGSFPDIGNGIACDAANNLVCVGTTNSANFPISTGTFQSSYGGGTMPLAQGDAFVIKFDPNGSRLWGTFLGGSSDEFGGSVAIDSNNDIIVGGGTRSASFPVTVGAAKPAYIGGGYDIFITKFNSNGASLWSTFYGSPVFDMFGYCAVDKHNNVFITWEGEDVDPLLRPTCAYQKTFGGGPTYGVEDQVISKFDKNGNYLCDTYLGGASEEDIDGNRGGLACYNGYIFTAMNVLGSAFPVTPGAFQSSYGGSWDCGIARLCGMSCGDTSTFNNATITSTQTGTGCYNIAMDFNQTYSPCDTANIFYQWNFTGATIASSSSKNPTNIIYPTIGSYPVSLKIITDCDTVLTSTIVTLTVSPTTISVSSNTTICSGNTTALSVNGATSYAWSPAIGLNSSNSAVVNASPNSTTTYTVSGIAPNGCNYSLPVTVNVNTKPSIQISGNNAVCLGALANLSASGATNYSWNTGATSTAIQIAPTTNNIYSVIGTDANGCTSITSATVSVHSLPIVTIIGSSPICVGSTTILTAAGAISYNWNTTNTNQTISVSPSITTTYSVNGIDVNGCTGSSTATVIANALPIANAGLDINICNGSSSQLNATGGTNYLWTPAIGLNNTSVANPIANSSATTTYTVTVSNGNGCSSTDDILITINALPIADAGVDDTVCIGINTTLQATGGINYSWSPAGSLSNPLINNPVASPLTNTSYTVVVTDINGCTASDNKILYVINLPTVNAGSDVSTCFGNSIWLSATGASTYSWSPSTGLSATTISNPVSTSSTTISYTVTGYAFGCSSEDNILVTVNALPVVSFTADNTSGCESVCVELLNTTINTLTALWTFGDGNSSQNAHTTNCYYNTGSYNVSLTITDANGCSNTLTQPSLITVYPKPVANFTMNPGVASINTPVNFIDLSTNANSWQWDFGDQPGKNSQLQNPIMNFGDSGNYNIRLIVSNEFGCRDTTTRMLYIMPEYTFFTPNTFTPDGNDLNDVFYPMSVGIDAANYHFWIYDRWGTLIWQTTTPGEGWNGKALNGNQVAQIDTYVWKIALKDIFGVKHSYIGSINLVK